MWRLINPWYHSDAIYRLTKHGQKYDKCVRILHEFHDKLIDKRRETLIKEIKINGNSLINSESDNRHYVSFLDTLIREELGGRLSRQDIRDEVNVFVVAGHDITSIAIYWALFVLATEPEAQARVHDELDGIFGSDSDRDMTLDDARRMKYLERCFKESARLYPATPLLARAVSGDLTVGDRVIPSGSTAAVLVSTVHKDPAHWPDPERFDPDRFRAESSATRHPYAFLGFSGGPRNCIAHKIGLIESKLILGGILRHFKVEPVRGRSEIHADPSVLLKPTKSVQLMFKPRISSGN